MSHDGKKSYDVVALLCGGLQRTDSGYRPTSFADSDEFGMLGGSVRVDAAVELAKMGVSNAFLFSTGVSAKQIEKFGPDVPPESYVYRDMFLAGLGTDIATEALEVFVEDKSVNTVGNIQGILQFCIDNNWRHVALLSSKYHIPRIRALVNLCLEQQELAVEFDFLEAETILRSLHPGVYDDQFDEAYSSDEGKKRMANEAKGQLALENGEYVLSEFQLSK